MNEDFNLDANLQPKKRTYSGFESILSWLCLLAGYTFCRVFPAGEHPLGAAIFLWCLYFGAVIILKIKAIRLSWLAVTVFGSGILVSFVLPLSGNRFLGFFAFVYSLAALGYFLYAALGNCIRAGFGNMIFMDFFKALFITPFFAMGDFFRAMFSGKFGRKVSLRVIIGIAIAILPTAIVFGLLSYDDGFVDIWFQLFDFNLFSHLGSLILGIPLGMYLFGLILASTETRAADYVSEEQCVSAGTQIRIAPVLTVLAAAIPLLFVYIIFFISQWKYYISGFSGVLPEGFSYADYAREGFFQLCAVSVINLCVMIGIGLFSRREGKGASAVHKALSLIFSLFTLILIATALAKLSMYIDTYGLTQKRVYAAWLMLVIAVFFILIPVGSFVKRIPVGAVSLAVLVVAFAILGLSNVDGAIAKYNVSHYLSGDLQQLDLETLYELGDPAVPHLVELADRLDKKNDLSVRDRQVLGALDDRLRGMYRHSKNHDSFFSLDLPKWRRIRALQSRYHSE